MKLPILIATALAGLVLAGCSQKEEAKAAAVPAAPAGPRVIELTGNDQMKYNITSMEMKVGEEVKVHMTNVGSMPKQAMAHNFVVLKPGSDAAAFATAAAPAADTDHIPPSLKDEIIAHTKLLGPKESDTVTLKFTEPGTYTYLCSFPAHYQVGMHGTITVK